MEQGDILISRETNGLLDYQIGNAALKNICTHTVHWPIHAGEIGNFELMEKFWHRCIFDYLRCEPEEHIFMMTEPPMNSPENREHLAEIMFETFNVEGLKIEVQAVLALYSSWYDAKPDSVQKKMGLTGTVLDSGDGVTHIIPIVTFFLSERKISYRKTGMSLAQPSSTFHWLGATSPNT